MKKPKYIETPEARYARGDLVSRIVFLRLAIQWARLVARDAQKDTAYSRADLSPRAYKNLIAVAKDAEQFSANMRHADAELSKEISKHRKRKEFDRAQLDRLEESLFQRDM